MVILLCTENVELARQLSTTLTEHGHDVTPWTIGEAVPAGCSLAIIEGLEAVVEAHDLPCHILAIVKHDELNLFAECPREIRDFVCHPVDVDALTARVARIAAAPTLQQVRLQRLFGEAVRRASDVVELFTPDCTLEYVNPAFEKATGIPVTEAIGENCGELTRSDRHPPEFYEEIEATLGRGEPWSGTMISKARDGRFVHFDTTITPLIDEYGMVTHHAAVKRDITDRLAQREALIQANKALEQARDAAVSASRTKSEFLANMSHELRTPLNAVIGYSEMLMEDLEENAEASADLKRIHSAGTHLLALINDVLDISKIEADKLELASEDVDLAPLLSGVQSTIEPLAAKNGNRFELVSNASVAAFQADRLRLHQVLLNLLSNACKFTKEGTITLAVSELSRDDRQWLTFAVMDTGIGIPADKREQLFQPFVQADSSTTREYGGTGLGLAISKRLVEMMGGDIAIESEVGVGSTFRITLPLNAAVAEDLVVESASGEGPLVLIIDDDSNIRDLCSRLLAKRGFNVHLASTGAQGLELAARLQPDAIVLDVQMPGMSGWEVLSTLKLNAATAGIPVIMMTVMQQREVGRALGAVDHLTKPVEPQTLAGTLRRHISHAPARVLLVEDDEAVRELLRRSLISEGHEVTEAENGQIGLERLEDGEFDLVILDLMMPVMDGFTFLHRLRDDERHARLPVVVATARHLSPEEKQELEQVAEEVLEKEAHSQVALLNSIGDQIAVLVARRRAKLEPSPTA